MDSIAGLAEVHVIAFTAYVDTIGLIPFHFIYTARSIVRDHKVVGRCVSGH